MALNTELIDLISNGVDASEIVIKISSGADIHAVGKMGLTALHHAVHRGDIDCVKLLLSHGCNTNLKDDCGYTSMHIAAKYGHGDIIRELFDSGADIHAKDEVGFTPLHLALQEGQSKCVGILLRKGANPNMYYKHMGYEIHMVNQLSPACLELLLQYGADPNTRNARGLTLLHLACQEGNVPFVQLLLIYGADINAKSQSPSRGDMTPLKCAVMEDERNVALTLLVNGADANEGDMRKNTPLHHAATQGNVEMAKILLEHGASIRAENEARACPLHKACCFSHDADIIRLFLEYGADPNAMTETGDTPITCLLWKYGQIAKDDIREVDRELRWKIGHLLNYGAKVNFVIDRRDAYTVMFAKLSKVDILCDSMSLLIETANKIAIHDNSGNAPSNLCCWVKEQLHHTKHNPRSLKFITRSCIRKRLQNTCPISIPTLPLPPPLIKYLQFM